VSLAAPFVAPFVALTTRLRMLRKERGLLNGRGFREKKPQCCTFERRLPATLTCWQI